LVKNLKSVIQNDRRPIWEHRKVSELTDFWKNRWGLPRAQRDSRYLKFNADKFIQKTLYDLQQYKRTCRII